MNKEKILPAMDHIDPALVEKADRAAPARRRIGWSRPGLIAACLCLVLAGTAVAAAGISKVRVAEWFDNQTFPDYGEGEYSGFKIVGGIAYIPGDRFSEEVNQIALSNPRKSVQRSFGSWRAMEEFIGWELMDNPVLSAARPATLPPCCIWVSAGEELTGISAEANYGLHSVYRMDDYGVWSYQDEVQIHLGADLYTEYYTETKVGQNEDEIAWVRHSYPEGTEYTQEEYVTPGGLEVTIFRITQPERKEYRRVSQWEFDFVPVEPTSYTAYFTMNGARFNVKAAHDTDAALALETLKEVLDGFVTEPQAK